MDTIGQFGDQVAGDGMTGLVRAHVQACVNEAMSVQADAMCEATGTTRNGFRERGLKSLGFM